jgi:hypothetical protein
VHAIPPSGVIGARPSRVLGLRYPGAACEKRMRAAPEIGNAGSRHEESMWQAGADRARVFR